MGRTLLAALLLAACAEAPPVDVRCTPLFDGATFAGWTPLGDADFDLEEDEAGAPVIAGRAVYGIPNSFLRTDAVYGDFDLTLSFRFDSGFNGFGDGNQRLETTHLKNFFHKLIQGA